MTRKTPSRTLGLDLGDVCVHHALVDSTGEIIQEGRVPTTSSELRGLVRRSHATRVVLEASTHSPWIARDLAALGIEVLVLNPNRLRAVSDSVRKTDRNDARLLAQLGHSGLLLWQVHHRGEAAQRCLQLLMGRDKVVRARTTLVNQVRGQVKSLGHRLPGLHAARFHTLRDQALLINPDLDLLFDLIETVSAAIDQFDRRLGELADNHPVVQRLMSIPGVGPITALAFVFVLDDPTRFRAARQVGPYLGLTPRKDQSGGVDKALPISKAGNGFLRRLLVTAGFSTLRAQGEPSALRDWGLRLEARGGSAARKRAAIAVARKLSAIMWRMWMDNTDWTPYPDLGQTT